MAKALLVALLLVAPFAASDKAAAEPCEESCLAPRVLASFLGSPGPRLDANDPLPPASTLLGNNADGTSWRITYFVAFYAGDEVVALSHAQIHLDAALRAYANQTSWGFASSDPDGILDITLDGCDCIFESMDANIHMFPRALDLLSFFPGLAYRSEAELAEIIIGHELFHHLQYGVQRWGMGDWLVEGMARFAETLSVPDGTFLPTTLTYVADDNGFNGFMRDPSRPLADGSYSWALVWGWLYAHEGGIALLNAVLEESAGVTGDPNIEGPAAIQRAMDRTPGGEHDTFEASYRAFARALLTGEGFVWGAPDGSGTHDWATYLDPVARSPPTAGPFQLLDWGIRVHDARPVAPPRSVIVAYAGAPVYAASLMTRTAGETMFRDAPPVSTAEPVDDAALLLVRLPAPVEDTTQLAGLYTVIVRY